jgi:F-type H+-transporting ATPase subunit gamma
MGAQLRVYRRRIRSVQATKKITKAMELIASSKIVKAQNQLLAARPYGEALYNAVSVAAGHAAAPGSHPLTSPPRLRNRAAVLVITSDRGLAGAYSYNALKEAEALFGLLQEQGIEAVPYVVGKKGVGYYTFRGRELGGSWQGFTDAPTPEDARPIAQALLDRFLMPTEDGGADFIYIIDTRYVNRVTQTSRATQVLPLEVVDEEPGDEAPPGGYYPLYEFEPSPEAVLDGLLPQYIEFLVYLALLNGAASEHAARQRAMSAATDNASEMITTLTRLANQARQSEITQEISEIVGGADALSAARGSE